MNRFLFVVCAMFCFSSAIDAAARQQSKSLPEIRERVKRLCDKASVFLEKRVLFKDSDNVIYHHAWDIVQSLNLVLQGHNKKARIRKVLIFVTQCPEASVPLLAKCIMMLAVFVADCGHLSDRLHCLVYNRSFLKDELLQKMAVSGDVDPTIPFPTEEHLVHWMGIVLPELERDIKNLCTAIPDQIKDDRVSGPTSWHEYTDELSTPEHEGDGIFDE